MTFISDDLFDYIGNVMFDPANAALNVEELPEEWRDFGRGLSYFVECVFETKELAQALSKGDLAGKLPSHGNEIAAPLKSLHASLKHLTWQAQQIAQGDYNQRVDFMGEFSDAFNTMVEQLAERQRKLEGKITLITTLMQHVPLQIIVMEKNTGEILLMNDVAKNEVAIDDSYTENIMRLIADKCVSGDECEVEITYTYGSITRYFEVHTYSLEWNNSNAEVYALNDVSATKSKIEELEICAYRDSVTQLYNRAFGMSAMERWRQENKQFVLIFADLDRLKYVNDEFGHAEGDKYIMNAAKHLNTFSPDAIVCRIGGDEFMLLVPDISYDKAYSTMCKIYLNFQCDEYLKDKKYSYSVSFGIVAVEPESPMLSGDILAIADERMYEYKKMRKMTRQQQTQQPAKGGDMFYVDFRSDKKEIEH